MIILYLLKESFLFALNSLVTNKLRTLLSLLGITIGIFAIITVFTVIDSLENSIRTSISKLGDNVIYVQKWPWAMGGDYPWWKYLNRPVPKLEEAGKIMKKSQLAKDAAFMIFAEKNIQFEDNYADNINIVGASHEYENIRSFELTEGRYFSLFESNNGKNFALIGSEIAKDLFPNINPIGKTIKMSGKKLKVIGVFKKEGSDLFGMNMDNQILIPINYAKSIFDLRNERLGPLIMIKANEGVSSNELIDELTGIMRSIRRLKPTEDDNFALNQSSLISQGFDSLFKIIDITGIIIGGFSILVGGFGIANIMFVSVKEQTKLIGIQKALGAKNYFILLQFLYESIILSLIGGVLGLLIIFIGTQIISSVFEMDFSLSLWNVSLGLIISISIGIISGIIPAYKAAKLNPVEAIAST
ncbi:MAG: ABC transporter permease [Bacteroidales bacterium]|nr:ABC transporter permease [Bacteroidales bacterium]MBN2758113.1 ABC transporter permease [Bacteroidales bacterium]